MGAALPIISLVATIAGPILGAMGQQQQGQAAAQMGQHNAAVARNNAILAQMQAVTAERIGGIKAAKEQLKARQLAGLQRAGAGARGVALGSGSIEDIISDTFGQGKLNAQTQRDIARRQALGFTTQAAGFEDQAGVALATGSNTASAFNLKATTTLLSGASSVASKWQDYKDLTT